MEQHQPQQFEEQPTPIMLTPTAAAATKMLEDWDIDDGSEGGGAHPGEDLGGSPPEIDIGAAAEWKQNMEEGSIGGGGSSKNCWNFSETEKIGTANHQIAAAGKSSGGGGGTVEERLEEMCCMLWNQIKDATVLDAHELSDSMLDHLQVQADHLAEQIQLVAAKQNTANAQLRLTTVWSALEQLKLKQQSERVSGAVDEAGAAAMFDGSSGGGRRRHCWMGHIRKWLHQQELELVRIRQHIPRSKNSMASLKELEMEQKALQEQIQNEGRAKHQQLCSAQQHDAADLLLNSVGGKGGETDEHRRLCESLEQRYLALWLASLESLELIAHFKATLAKKHPDQRALLNCSGELGEEEVGPDPKRRKTTDQHQREELQKSEGAERGQKTEEKENMGTREFEETGGQQPQRPKTSLTSILSATSGIGTLGSGNECMNNGICSAIDAEQNKETGEKEHEHHLGGLLCAQQQQNALLGSSDIGYSSGENNSVHEGEYAAKMDNKRESQLLVEEGNQEKADDDGWAEQIAQSSELEKSFYRTVPLDDYGMTDNEGTTSWPRSNSYLAQKFMDDGNGGEGGGLLQQQLTDSLIVHVDNTPEENRHLNDFEEVMDLLDQQPPMQTASTKFMDDDDCDSLSTNNEQENNTSGRAKWLANGGGSRKRTAAMGKMPTPPSLTATPQRRNGGGRRKWATVRKGHRTLSTGNNDLWSRGVGNVGGWWSANSSSNYLSSDFEWDEDFATPLANNNNKFGGGMAKGHRARMGEAAENRNVENENMSVELPELEDDLDGEGPLLFARKKALRAFRDGLRQAAADSGLVSVRLQELLALVDKSLGGVDSAAYLLTELNRTFCSLSQLCQSLECKMRNSGGKFGGDSDVDEEEKENHDQQRQGEAGTKEERFCQIKDVQSELMLCHERMNALETTCNNLALLLGTHLGQNGEGTCGTAAAVDHDPHQEGNAATADGAEQHEYLAQFATECNRIREELQKLKSRFNEKFVFCTIEVSPAWKMPDQFAWQTAAVAHPKVDCFAQTAPEKSSSFHCSVGTPRQREASFWRSYLLLCLLGFVASLSAWLYAGTREGTDWRWSVGPQLNYVNGPPPV